MPNPVGRPRKYPRPEEQFAGVPSALAEAPINPEREEVLEDLAEDRGGYTEKDCSIGWEFYWRAGDADFRYYVSDERVGVRVENNAEFYGGNQDFFYHYRGNVLVNTNDPRQRKQVEPDPGPEVEVIGGSGQCVTMKVAEFLELVNKNNARKRWMLGKR